MTIWIPHLEGRAGPRYRAIADAIEEDLASGRLPSGARLPTHRGLAERLHVTVGTVSRAYAEAARRGLLSGEVGRGTFARAAVPDEGASPTELAGVVDLGVNHPPLPADDPVRPALQEALSRLAARATTAALMGYPPDGGHRAHAEAGALWLRKVGLEADPERVLVCSGSQHAVATVLQALLRSGDAVATEWLTYPGFKSVASLLDLRLVGLATDAEGLVPEDFDQACRAGGIKALYCVSTIHNPTGAVMGVERRRQVAAIARRHGVVIVDDDVHALLPEQRLAPLASFAPELSYHVAGTSKSLAPGLRVAYLLAPPAARARLASVLRATVWASAPLMAEIASLWIRGGEADRILDARRREAAARQTLARDRLPRASYDAHPLGYHLWLRLPEPWTSQAFVAEARRRGAALTPAEAFLVGRGPAPRAVRVCLGAARSRAVLERGLGLVAQTLDASPEAALPVV